MCGILALVSDSEISSSARAEVHKLARRQRHRGPDEGGIITFQRGVFAHDRLALVGAETGLQPFESEDKSLLLIASCEIYNWKQLEKLISTKQKHAFSARSDADVVLGLYPFCDAVELLTSLCGMFAFVLYDKKHDHVFITRDPFGIIPLYYGFDSKKRLWVSTEMKCMVGVCNYIESFKPGSFFCGPVSQQLEQQEYYIPCWKNVVPKGTFDDYEFRQRLSEAVASHLPQGDAACLLSGGLDSSLIAALAQRILRSTERQLATYSVGIQGSPDLHYAKEVAQFIGSHHTELLFTPEQGIDCIPEVIWHLETYDVTTIRAGIPMYLLARRVKKDGYKMLLSGEGADEVFGGYLYFHQAPGAEAFHYETVSRILNISYADCLRANKSTMAWGVEVRVPFLSTPFVDYAMNIAPEARMIPSSADPKRRPCEKFIVRKAFSDDYCLPSSIIWRQKEQFSDGVGYAWIDQLRAEAERCVSDQEFAQATTLFPYNTPDTKEAFFYRTLYQEMFGTCAEKTLRKWIPRTDWGCAADPSGRVQRVHQQAAFSLPSSSEGCTPS